MGRSIEGGVTNLRDGIQSGRKMRPRRGPTLFSDVLARIPSACPQEESRPNPAFQPALALFVLCSRHQADPVPVTATSGFRALRRPTTPVEPGHCPAGRPAWAPSPSRSCVRSAVRPDARTPSNADKLRQPISSGQTVT